KRGDCRCHQPRTGIAGPLRGRRRNGRRSIAVPAKGIRGFPVRIRRARRKGARNYVGSLALTHEMTTPTDQQFMQQALQLAEQSVGLASPNPNVGALVVSDSGEVVGSGHYTYDGLKHAE